MNRAKRGVTLIELMIVVVIVGILAAIAPPMMRAMRTRAIVSEAVMAMGTLQTLVQQYYFEFDEFPGGGVLYSYCPNGTRDRNLATDIATKLGIGDNDFAGRYFSGKMYCFGHDDGTGNGKVAMSCTFTCSDTGAPMDIVYTTLAGVKDTWASIDMSAQGIVTTTNIPHSGYPNANWDRYIGPHPGDNKNSPGGGQYDIYYTYD